MSNFTLIVQILILLTLNFRKMDFSYCTEGNTSKTTLSWDNISDSQEIEQTYFSPLFGVCLALPEW